MNDGNPAASLPPLPRDRLTAALALVPVAAALGIACGVTVLLITVFNYMIEPIGRDLGLSRPETTAALSVHLAMLIIALPAAGALADRFGARRVICASAVLFGLALLGISRVEGGRVALYAAFALAGLAGAGASPVTYARVIVHRFNAHRGLALGIALSGTGLGGALLPALAQPIVVEQGWREAFQALAMLAAGVGLLAGLSVGSGKAASGGPAAAAGYTLRGAAQRGVFWQMTAAFALLGMVLSGVIAHLTSIWQGLGISAVHVPAFQATVGMATIAGRLGGGAMMDLVPAHFVGAVAALLGAAGIALLASGPDTALLLLLVGIALGVCTGAESDVISYLSSRYFGLRNFARIYAVQGSFFMIGFALGPLVAAYSLDRGGIPATLAGGAVVLLGSATMLAILRAPPPASGESPAVGRGP